VHVVRAMLKSWMPPDLADAPPEEVSRGQTALGFAVVVALAATPYALLYLALGMWIAGGSAAVAALMAFVVAWRFHHNGNLCFAAHGLALTVTVGLCGVTLQTGGIHSPVAPWFLLPPMIPAMVVGKQRGLPWVAFAALWLSALYYAESQGIVVPDLHPSPTWTSLYHLAVPVSLSIALSAIAWTYETAKEGALHRIYQMGAALEASRDEAEDAHAQARQILDTIRDGLLVVCPDGRVQAECSSAVAQFVTPPQEGQMLWELFQPADATFAEWLELSWDDLGDDWMPIEVILDQLPSRVVIGEMHVDLGYTPIMDGERLERVLVTLSDVTAEVKAAEQAKAQEELLTVFVKSLQDAHGVKAFFEETEELLWRVASGGGTEVQLKRWVHTLKGNCAVFGLDRLAAWLHAMEDRMAESGKPSITDRFQLLDQWEGLLELMEPVLDNGGAHTLQVERKLYEATVALAARGTPGVIIAEEMRRWTWRRVDLQLDQLADRANALLKKVGKEHTQVAVEAVDERIPPTPGWADFFGSLVHVVRNAIDHGIETADEREQAGKPPEANLVLRASVHAGYLQVEVSDDGAGIDWARLCASAQAQGMPCTTKDERVALLFADGVSSRDEVTELSGRGVGAAAVREAALSLGGAVEVDTLPGKGTTFRFLLPMDAESQVGQIKLLPRSA